MNIKQFRPLLAATYEHGSTNLVFPVLASPKLDGIRCLIRDGHAVSRTLKPIQNRYIQQEIGDWNYEDLDGELIVGASSGPLVYNRTNSGVMSRDGEPDFHYFVFDLITFVDAPYVERLDALISHMADSPHPRIHVLDHVLLNDPADLSAYEINCLDVGFEGIMLRSIDGQYKYGRSTANEGYIWKVKRFEDYEARVVAFVAAEKNNNPRLVDALGHTIRSQVKAGMEETTMIGALICVRINATGQPSSEPFRVAPGTMTHEERKKFFADPSLIMGKIIKCKEFAYGKVNQPRFARFHGLRDPIDM